MKGLLGLEQVFQCHLPLASHTDQYTRYGSNLSRLDVLYDIRALYHI